MVEKFRELGVVSMHKEVPSLEKEWEGLSFLLSG